MRPEGGKMRKRIWVCYALLFIVPGLLLMASCAPKQPVEPEPAVTESEMETIAQKAAETARQEAAKKKAREEEEEERRQARIRIERQKAAAAERRAKADAKRKFLNEDVYFDFDSSVLLPAAEQVLKLKAEWLRTNSGVSVMIEGHCDERGTNEYNLALGDRRAESAKAYLMNLGIDASRLTSNSYGEERPVDPGHDEAAWAKNRRAHFAVN